MTTALRLDSPAAHGTLLHGTRPGHVALAHRTGAGWQEKAHGLLSLLRFCCGDSTMGTLTYNTFNSSQGVRCKYCSLNSRFRTFP
jgi:hypothetical protein